MEGNFDEEQFSRFRQEGEENRQATEQFYITLNRLKTFLEEQGVVFSEDPNAEFTDENYGRLKFFTTMACFEAVAKVSGKSLSENNNFKKELQAKCIVRGMDSPWIDLIDMEFDGEPINDNDTALMAEVAIDVILEEESSRQWFDQAMTEMKNFLLSNGVEELTPQEIHILVSFATLKRRANLKGDPRRFLENARNYLYKSNITDDAWFKLVEKYFG